MKKILFSILFLTQIKTIKSQDICSDLTSQYSFDNTLSNHYNGSPFSGSGAYAPHLNGQCVLTASNATRTVNIPGIPTGNSTRTIAMWFQPTGNASGTPHVFRYGGGGTGQSFGAYYTVSTQTLTFQGMGVANEVNIPNTQVQQGTWLHLAMTYDGSDLAVYINGQLKTQATLTLTTGNTVPFTLGGNGQIYHDELKIYDRTLTAADIAELYNHSDTTCVANPDICSDLVTSYSFDQTNGNQSNIEQFSGFGAFIDAMAGEAKVSSSALTANISNLPTSNSARTIAFWLRPNPITGDVNVFGYGVNQPGERFGAYRNGTLGRLVFQGFGSGFDKTIMNGTLQNSTWTHIAITYNGTTLNGYVNGALAASHPLNLNTGAASTFTLGATTGDAFDDLKIFNRALNQADIYELYTKPQHLCGITSGIDLCENLMTSYSFNNVAHNQSILEDFSETTQTTLTYTTGVASDAINCVAGLSYTATISGLPMGNSPRTVSMWIKNTNSTSSPNIFNYGGASSGSKFGLYLTASTGSLSFQGFGGGNDQVINNTTIGNTWNHIVAVYTGTFVQIYVNGVCKETFQRSLTTATNGMLFTLGQFGGLADDLRIYNRALSQEDIDDLYANPEYSCSITTSIADNKQIETSLNLYPNPATNIITISSDELSNNKNLSVEIVNSLGAVILSQNSITENDNTINIQSLSNGIYFVQIKTDNKIMATKKLVINK